MDNEYPPEARFGWDMITLTEAESNEVSDWADIGEFEKADAVVDRAERRLFGLEV